MSCKCQGCGTNYKVDILVVDSLWEKIKPQGKPEGAGLLCGKCIFERIESLDEYDYYFLETTHNSEREDDGSE